MSGSWKTSLVGYIMIASGILAFIAEAVAKSGIPDTIMEWVTFGTLVIGGIVGILAKDGDVSNSPHPASATTVSAVDAVKTNPSAPPVK